ncbi:MAG: hypothetical protein KKB70_05025 [Proteobacteria bacterium]|nr:hypothetical protein [Pseudomonadota bacterium]
MRLIAILAASILSLALCLGCGVRSQSPEAYLAHRGLALPLGGQLQVCTGFGCTVQAQVVLTAADLEAVDQCFQPLDPGAELERQQMAEAVARLETLVGHRVGTYGDLGRNRRDKARSGQLDCIAETANTTAYLLLLKQRGLIRHHEVIPPEHRGGSVFTAHNTAVIRDATGDEFAVDSWFHDNGVPPEVVPLELWRQGFQPSQNVSQPNKTVSTTTEEDHGV